MTMTSSTGSLTVPEGVLYYSLTKPESGGTDRPPLLFLHAGVSDHHLWDASVAHFNAAGWTCLALDQLGFGQSLPSRSFLDSDPRPLANLQDHWALAINSLLDGRPAIVIGCSMGGANALEFTLQRPELVAGYVTVGGGLPGFETPPPEGEKKLLEEQERLSNAKDVDGLARFHVHFWGDGPLQPEGRASSEVRDKLYAWNTVICAAEVKNEGGGALDVIETERVLERLGEIKVPTAIAWGKFDQTNVNLGLQHLAKEVKGAELQEFEAAHLISLEQPEEFNKWLEKFLGKHFVK